MSMQTLEKRIWREAPPDGVAPAAPAVATDLPTVDRTATDAAKMLRMDIPELGLQAPIARAEE